ncbi:hypothetical protein PC117_g18049 [Phytophthora cactorum]|uniref:Uncharacterized protein n=1 Tax=Phytophthora cactorum TaxID=29920 RepID=A0A8T1C9I5_9STRA|nr:hypothetical protein PC117_g18049 [Phytophthora cactorum]
MVEMTGMRTAPERRELCLPGSAAERNHICGNEEEEPALTATELELATSCVMVTEAERHRHTQRANRRREMEDEETKTEFVNVVDLRPPTTVVQRFLGYRGRPSASKDVTAFKLLKPRTRQKATSRCRSSQAVLISNNGTGRIRIERTRTDGHGTKTRRPLGATFGEARRPFERSAMVQDESITSEESLGMRSGS